MLIIETYERRDIADRNELALAALQLCRTLRAQDSVKSAKFYWEDWDRLAVVTERDTWNMDGNPIPEAAKASSGLANLAQRVEFRLLAEAAIGQQAYERADRPSGVS